VELARQLTVALEARGIKADDEAKVVISGTFMEAEPRLPEDATDEQKRSARQGIQLEGRLTDNLKGENQENWHITLYSIRSLSR